MNRFNAVGEKLAEHPLLQCGAAIATVVQILLWGFEAAGKIPELELAPTLGYHGAFITAGVVGFGIYLNNRSVKRMRDSFIKIHDINHLYRNALAETSVKLLSLKGEIGTKERAPQVNKILGEIEVTTTDRILSIIAEQFQMLIKRPVVVTFWRVNLDGKTCTEQETSANGVDASRPYRCKDKFSIADNSVFHENRDKMGKCCHYYSADLKKTQGSEEGYRDERPNFIQFYQSVLCVPIRFSWKTEGGGRQEDLLGYLQIDTRSRNRLNNNEHLYLLSAYADQFYNFLSLVSRNFILS